MAPATITMPDGEFVYFHGRAKQPYQQLSNFYQTTLRFVWPSNKIGSTTIPAHMQGRSVVYPSSEHAYQALLAADDASARMFEEGGRFADWECFKTWPVKSKRSEDDGVKTMDDFQKKCKAWRGQGSIGIIAKMVSNMDRRLLASGFGANLVMKKDVSRFDITLWLFILEQKYVPDATATAVLLGTGKKVLIEFDRMAAKRGSFYGGLVQNGELHGRNKMGILLMIVKQRLVEAAAAAAAVAQP